VPGILSYNYLVRTNPLGRLDLTDDRAANLETMRRYAWILDSLFEIPVVKVRVGLDAIAGLVPGLGDLTTPVFSGYLLLQAFRMRVPKIILARMVFNVALDALVGLVPILGDLFDIGFKANMRNLALVERHADPFQKPTRADYMFVWAMLGVLAALALLPIMLFLMLLYFTGILSNRPLV
jgi:Domain of unknown function (DUF4112)